MKSKKHQLGFFVTTRAEWLKGLKLTIDAEYKLYIQPDWQPYKTRGASSTQPWSSPLLSNAFDLGDRLDSTVINACALQYLILVSQ